MRRTVLPPTHRIPSPCYSRRLPSFGRPLVPTPLHLWRLPPDPRLSAVRARLLHLISGRSLVFLVRPLWLITNTDCGFILGVCYALNPCDPLSSCMAEPGTFPTKRLMHAKQVVCALSMPAGVSSKTAATRLTLSRPPSWFSKTI